MKTNIKYRPEVDGIRFLAVLLVYLCHLDVEYFSGGYVGVDVFFVISGYLITSLISKELTENGNFDFTNFYLRRIRRILPALIFTIIWVLFVGFFVFTPSHFQSASEAGFYSIFGVSNIYFWLTSDYFDNAALIQPLLHTWSLAVEEQFYLIWPAIMVLLFRFAGRKGWISCALLFGLFSLWLSIYFDSLSQFNLAQAPEWLRDIAVDGSSLTYYLSPFRAYELLFGALLSVVSFNFKSRYLASVVSVLGIGFILGASFSFDEHTSFPSYNALYPAIGAGLLISSLGSSFLNAAFANPLSVYLGRISYSIYLAHWPVIVYYRYVTGANWSLMDYVVMSMATLLVASFSYHFVEQRFRNQRSGSNVKYLLQVAAVSSSVILVANSIVVSNGWFWRLDKQSQNLAARFSNPDRIETLYAGGSNCLYTYKEGLGPYCETNPIAEKHVWLLGDSHARHLAHGLSNIWPNINFRFFKNNCRFDTLDYCYVIGKDIRELHMEHKKNILSHVASDSSPIIIAQTWTRREEAYIPIAAGDELGFDEKVAFFEFVSNEILGVKDYFQEHFEGRRIIVVGDVPRPRISSGGSPIDCLMYPLDMMKDGCDSVRIGAADDRRRFNNFLAEEFPNTNAKDVVYVDPFNAFCDSGTNECRNYTEDGDPIYIDNSHLSIWGSQELLLALYPKLRYGLRDYIEGRNYYN